MKLIITTILLLISKLLIAQTDYLNLPLYNGVGYGEITDSTVTFTISGKKFTNNNSGFASGSGLKITNSSNITIEDCFFDGTYESMLHLFQSSNITVRRCVFANGNWGVRIQFTTGNIKILNNEFINMYGERLGQGCCRGQAISTDNCDGTGNQISWNRIINYFGESFNEDNITLWQSHGTSGSPIRISGNVLWGMGPSTSGIGIIMGDGGSEYLVSDSNRVIYGGWGGMAIAGGSHMVLTNNKVFAERRRWSGTGYYINNYSAPAASSDHSLGASNLAYYEIYTTGGQDNWWNNCTGATNCNCAPASCPGPGSLGANKAAALAAIISGVPDPLITFLSVDDVWKIRAEKFRYADIVDHGTDNAGGGGAAPERIDLSRPSANAGPDQPSVTTTTAVLNASGSSATQPTAPMNTVTNTIAGYNWVQVSGPNTATMSASTSATNNLSGLVTGTYIFRLEVTQTQAYNNATFPDNFNYQTWHADWVTVTVSTSAQTKYYISNSGSDAAAGTLAAPWQTIAKVNSSTFNAGDSIFFNKGNTWREQLTIPSSGAVNNRIVFTAYGTGAKPIINGADIKTGWVDGYNNINANIWGTGSTNAVTTRAMVVINGTIYAEVSAITGLTTPNTYFIKTASTPDSLYVYNTTDPDALTAEVSKREYCIVTAAGASSKRYIEIADLEVRYAGRAGIYFEGPGSGVGDALNGSSYVRRCFAYANRLFGVVNYDHYDSLVVEDSKATYNGNGFYSWQADEGTFRRDTTSNQIHYEAISVFTDGGAIQGYQSDNWLAEYCYSDADYDAIHIDAGNIAVDATIRYNKVFNSRSGSPSTPGYGIGNTAAGSVINMYYNLAVNCASASQESSLVAHAGTINVYNNTFYHNTSTGTDGIVYFNHGTGYTFKNNLYVRDYVAGEFNFVVLNSPMSTNNYNNYYILNNVSGTLRNWYSGAAYTTMAAWRTATSQDANSITVDPLFVNVASDWSLQSGSPCRNAGVSVGLTQDINGNPIVGLPDIGAYELQTLRYKGRIF